MSLQDDITQRLIYSSMLQDNYKGQGNKVMLIINCNI